MKYAAYLLSGLAWASLFPEAVKAGAAGNPVYFLLGSFAALIPHFASELIIKNSQKFDAEIAPDPLNPNASEIAGAIACLIGKTRDSGGRTSVCLHPARISEYDWLNYEIFFDSGARSVSAAFGTASGRAPGEGEICGKSHLSAPIRIPEKARVRIEGGEEKILVFETTGNGTVSVRIFRPTFDLRQSIMAVLLILLLAAFLWGKTAGITAGGAAAIGFALLNTAPESETDSRYRFFAIAWLSMMIILWSLYLRSPVSFPVLSFFRTTALITAVPFVLHFFFPTVNNRPVKTKER